MFAIMVIRFLPDMNPAINFDDQLFLAAAKINNISSNRILANKLTAIDFTIP